MSMKALLVVVIPTHLEQFTVVLDFLLETTQHQDHIIKRFFLFAQFLGFFGVIPNRWIFQRGIDRAKAFYFGIVVKDTPEGPGYEP